MFRAGVAEKVPAVKEELEEELEEELDSLTCKIVSAAGPLLQSDI